MNRIEQWASSQAMPERPEAPGAGRDARLIAWIATPPGREYAMSDQDLIQPEDTAGERARRPADSR